MTQQKIFEKNKNVVQFLLYIVVLPCNKILQIYKFVYVETSSGVTYFP
jgi:hypothetical protein